MVDLRCALAALALSPTSALAQNAGGVFPPFVDEGHKSAEYRITFRPGENGGPDRMTNRLHYQQAINGDLMWRIVGQISGPTDDQDLDALQAELFWELTEDDDAFWRTGLRFDATVREGSGPEELRLNWTNSFQLSDRWQARAVLLNKRQFGDLGEEGVGFETRLNLSYTFDGGANLGVESYNIHGNTENFDAFGGRQQVGPYAFIPLGQDWRIFTGALFGANENSPDTDIRFWITRNF